MKAATARIRRRGRRAEQNVYGRPVSLLPWSHRKADSVVLDHEVTVRRSDQNFSDTKVIPIFGLTALQPSGPLQDARQRARAGRRDVDDYADRRREVGGEPRDHACERGDAPGGRTNDDEVTSRARIICHVVPASQSTAYLVRVAFQPAPPDNLSGGRIALRLA